MNRHRSSSAALGLVFCLLANGALAQYVWIDEKGVKQFSDMPPPASVPANRILKQPGGAPAKAASVDGEQPAETAKQASAQTKGPMTITEQNAEFKKRRAEQAEKEKKAAEQAKRDADKTANCDRTRAYLRSLESGVRISRTDKDGERAYMSDEQRERDMQEARTRLADCK